MLKLFSKTGGRKKRAPRDAIKCTATIRVDNSFLRAQLHDVSASGCKVGLEEALEPGKFVQIALESYHSLGAQIRWCREGFAGIQFIRPLSDAALSNWKRAVVNGAGTQVVGQPAAATRRDFWGEVRHLEDE